MTHKEPLPNTPTPPRWKTGDKLSADNLNKTTDVVRERLSNAPPPAQKPNRPVGSRVADPLKVYVVTAVDADNRRVMVSWCDSNGQPGPNRDDDIELVTLP